MIFVSHRPYGDQVFAARLADRGSSNEMQEVSYQRFGRFNAHGRPLGASEETPSLVLGEVGLPQHRTRLVGFYDIPASAWTSSGGAIPTLLSFLVDWYLTKRVETPFLQWIKENPNLGRGSRNPEKVHGLFRTYEGDMLLVSVQGERLEVLPVTESCYILEGRVTTIEEAMALREADLQKRVDAMSTEHAELRKQSYDFPELVNRTNLSQFARRR